MSSIVKLSLLGIGKQKHGCLNAVHMSRFHTHFKKYIYFVYLSVNNALHIKISPIFRNDEKPKVLLLIFSEDRTENDPGNPIIPGPFIQPSWAVTPKHKKRFDHLARRLFGYDVNHRINSHWLWAISEVGDHTIGLGKTGTPFVQFWHCEGVNSTHKNDLLGV